MIMTGCIRVYGYVFGLFVGGVLFLFFILFFELVVFLALCFFVESLILAQDERWRRA